MSQLLMLVCCAGVPSMFLHTSKACPLLRYSSFDPVLLTDSADIDDAVELRTVDENKLVLTLRLVPSSASAAGWTRLGVVASRQMQAKLGEDAVIQDQTYRLSRSLYRLN